MKKGYFALVIFIHSAICLYCNESPDSCKYYNQKFEELRNNDLDSALSIAKKHLAYSKTIEIDSCYFQALNNLIISFSKKNDKDSILLYHSMLKTDPKLSSMLEAGYRADITLGSFLSNNSQSDSAIQVLTPLFDKSLSPELYVNACLKIGISYANSFDNETCLEYLQKADSVNRISKLSGLTESELYSLYGLTYHKSIAYEDAVKYYKKSIDLKKQIKDYSMLAYLYNNTALAQQGLDSLEAATQSIDSALIYLKYLPSFEGSIYWTKGKLHQAKDEDLEAIESYEKLIKIYGDSKSNNANMYIYNAIRSLLYSKVKLNHKSGYSKYYNMIDPDILTKFKLRDSVHFGSYLLIENLYKKDDQLGNDFTDLYSVFNKYIVESQDEVIAKELKKYETEKKEQEIVLLQKEQELSDVQLQKQNSLLLGGGMGLLGSGFGIFYLLSARRKEKELYERDIAGLERENKEWYEKVQRYRATKQKIAIRDEDVIKINGDGPILPLVDLKYVQSQGNYVNIFVKGQEKPVLLRYPLSKFHEEYLPQNIFARVNNSTIVNLNYILKKRASAIFVDDSGTEKQFNIGRTYKDDFQKLYDDLPNV